MARTTPILPGAAHDKAGQRRPTGDQQEPSSGRRRGIRVPRRLQGWGYAAPTAAFVLVFFVLPVLLLTRMAFSDWSLLAGNQGWNGLDNFAAVLDLPQFWQAVGFTLKYTVITTVLLLGLALGLALLVQETTRYKGFLRTSFLVPGALGLAAASLLFYALYSQQSGPLNPLLMSLGIIDQPISFLATPERALWSTVFLIVWRYAGFYMLLLMVGLQSISGDVYEAAEVDGANRWQTFRSITLPLLRPSLALCTILTVTGSLLAFDQFYILTKGGPDNSTLTIVQLMYNIAFQGRNDLGIAAALSILVLVALVVINAAQLLALRKEA